jgi:phosphopantothenoylcysteine decarboxylase/phosphopantothenate--cysteine ligase
VLLIAHLAPGLTAGLPPDSPSQAFRSALAVSKRKKTGAVPRCARCQPRHIFFAFLAFFAVNSGMNCIVTAGPTFEPLDDVRRLTNFSTGKLGTELANFLTGHGHHVTLLIGESATWPGERKAHSVKSFSSTKDLRSKLKSFAGKNIDAIFHASAVSDFSFGKMFTHDAAGKLIPFKPSKKISTRDGSLFVELVPTPKIIAELRGWFPKTKIIGWKFEADGVRADALRSAKKQLADCATDACVANGPAYGKGYSLVTPRAQKHFPDTTKLFTALEKMI